MKRTQGDRLIILCIYVDDTIAAYHKQDKDVWLKDKATIAASYQIKDLGECKWILNMRVTRNRDARLLTLCQDAYIERVLKQFDMDGAKPATNPETANCLAMPLDGTEPIPLDPREHATYRSLIGALLYASNTTRVDIAHAVGVMSRYVDAPQQHHLRAARQCLRYLRGTTNLGMVFGNNSRPPNNHTIVAFTDASWGNDLGDRKSTTGTVIKYNGNVISWVSKKQATVATSTTEAEYVALGTAAKEVLWYRMWIQEVFGIETTPLILGDNKSSLQLVKNDCHHSRTKHIDIAHHFVRDHYYNKHISLEYVRTEENEADILTKMIATNQFVKLCNKLLTNASIKLMGECLSINLKSKQL